jgi:hypothetical protein
MTTRDLARPIAALAIAVIVATACSASGDRNAPSAVGSPSAEPSRLVETATLVPEAVPSAAALEPTPTPELPIIGAADPLTAGRYLTATALPARISLAVPDGWAAFEGDGVRKADALPPAGMGVRVLFVDNVYADPCHWKNALADPPIGTSVEELVDAVGDQRERAPQVREETTIDGRPASVIEWTVPKDVDLAACDDGQYRTFTTTDWYRTAYGVAEQHAASEIDRLFVVDLAGRRTVIDASFYPATDVADRAELDAIVASVRMSTDAP